MPKLGELKSDYQLDRGHNYTKFIWSACEICGKKRWVQLYKGQPRDKKCPHCVRMNREKRNCLYCGVEFEVVPSSKKILCSSVCMGKSRSLGNHPNWKGGKFKQAADGYVRVLITPDDFYFPMANHLGYVCEHRLVVAKHLGRCLQDWEVVHHKNGIRDDNQLENLELTDTIGGHSKSHSKGYKDGYQKGLTDGRGKQIQKLRARIKELESR